MHWQHQNCEARACVRARLRSTSARADTEPPDREDAAELFVQDRTCIGWDESFHALICTQTYTDTRARSRILGCSCTTLVHSLHRADTDKHTHARTHAHKHTLTFTDILESGEKKSPLRRCARVRFSPPKTVATSCSPACRPSRFA